MFKKIKRSSAAARLLEEQLYEKVAIELVNGQRREGLWVKALSNSAGSEEKANALYIQYRVQSIKDEIELTNEIVEEVQNQKNRALVAERLRGRGQKSTVSKNSTERYEITASAVNSGSFEKDNYEWFYSDGEKECGPKTTEEIIEIIEEEKITEKYLVWKSGMNVWEPITETFFAGYIKNPPLTGSHQLLCIKCQRNFEGEKKYCVVCNSSDFVVVR